MAKAGEILTNPEGEQLHFNKTAGETDGELLEVEMTYNPQSERPPEHYHPYQAERFEVLSGLIRASVGGGERDFKPGEMINVPKGVPHWMHNTSDEVGRVIWQTRPAMRTEVFFENLWGLARDGKANKAGVPNLLQIAVLFREFSDHFRLTSPPYFFQQILFFVLAPLGRLKGYRAVYPEYSGDDA